jgi:hypothetical protein
MLKLEIVTGIKGPEPDMWEVFPGLAPTAVSQFFNVYAAQGDQDLSPFQEGFLETQVMEGTILGYHLGEADGEVRGYITTAEAAQRSGKSSSYWRNKCAAGEVPGAYKPGSDKYWLMPVSAIRDF